MKVGYWGPTHLKMLFKLILVLTTCYVSFLTIVNSSESFLARMESEVEDYCDLNQKVRLQFLFVYDRTYTFAQVRGIFSLFSSQLIPKVQKRFPGSEFGVVTFADYDPSAGLTDPVEHRQNGAPRAESEVGYPIVGPHDCYEVRQKFTTDIQTIRDSFHSIQGRKGANGTNWQIAESGLTALIFAAADKSIGWIKGFKDANGNIVRKVLAFVTDATSTRRLRNEEGRHEVKGDGTDLCNTTLPPSDQLVEKILKENHMAVIGLYHIDFEYYNINILDYYQGIFGRMDIPYHAFEIDKSNEKDILDKALSSLQYTVECTPGDPVAYNTVGL